MILPFKEHLTEEEDRVSIAFTKSCRAVIRGFPAFQVIEYSKHVASNFTEVVSGVPHDKLYCSIIGDSAFPDSFKSVAERAVCWRIILCDVSMLLKNRNNY